jgi:predicted small secreted protein
MNTITRNVSAPSLLLLLVLAFASILVLPGCQTMKGAGKDVERAGEKIQENADNHN